MEGGAVLPTATVHSVNQSGHDMFHWVPGSECQQQIPLKIEMFFLLWMEKGYAGVKSDVRGPKKPVIHVHKRR